MISNLSSTMIPNVGCVPLYFITAGFEIPRMNGIEYRRIYKHYPVYSRLTTDLQWV